jgi:4a-hydroxytetrahydrobiopterin dehydratase
MTGLARRQCRPVAAGSAMSADEIDAHLAQVQGWVLAHGAIEKAYDFADYRDTLAFVNAVGWIAQRQDHHPDLAVGYSRCTVRLSTHSAGGISINDFICAARIDALFD